MITDTIWFVLVISVKKKKKKKGQRLKFSCPPPVSNVYFCRLGSKPLTLNYQDLPQNLRWAFWNWVLRAAEGFPLWFLVEWNFRDWCIQHTKDLQVILFSQTPPQESLWKYLQSKWYSPRAWIFGTQSVIAASFAFRSPAVFSKNWSLACSYAHLRNQTCIPFMWCSRISRVNHQWLKSGRGCQ